MNEHELGVRARILGIFIGMLKEIGYSRAQLIREIKVCWPLVK